MPTSERSTTRPMMGLTDQGLEVEDPAETDLCCSPNHVRRHDNEEQHGSEESKRKVDPCDADRSW